MLTKSDLHAIGTLMDEKLEPVKNDVQTIKKSLKKVEKTVDIMARSLDREDMQLRKRVDRIETKIGITTQ